MIWVKVLPMMEEMTRREMNIPVQSRDDGAVATNSCKKWENSILWNVFRTPLNYSTTYFQLVSILILAIFPTFHPSSMHFTVVIWGSMRDHLNNLYKEKMTEHLIYILSISRCYPDLLLYYLKKASDLAITYHHIPTTILNHHLLKSSAWRYQNFYHHNYV